MIIEFIEKNFDDYNRKARLTPALFVSLPIALAAIAIFPYNVWSWGGGLGLLAWFGVLRFLAQRARDMGKSKEEELYSSWGGKPTTYALRHRTTQNKVELARLHRKLNELTSQPMPTLSEELNDPDLADQTYETCVKFLLAKTRDHSKFSLLYEENCNYGYRRNLFGMKPLGIITSSVGILFLGAKCAFAIGLPNLITTWQRGNSIQTFLNLQFSNCVPLTLAFLVVNIFLYTAWFRWINSDWVKNAADAYAHRLLESCENLA